MKIKGLEEANEDLRLHGFKGMSLDNKVIIKKSAQTMLELMKAREKASDGEWDWTGDIFGTAGNQTILCCNRLFDHEGLQFRYQENAQFITLAANLTRETGDED